MLRTCLCMDLFVLCVLVLTASSVMSVDYVHVEPLNPELFETQSLNLVCNSTLTAALNFSWLRNGALLLESTTSNLTVMSVPLEWDQSVLTCVVGGVGNTSVTLTVRSLSPVFTEHPLSQTVLQGQNFNLSCSAIGLPTPRIVWYQDGSQFHLVQPDREGTLIFFDATDEYAGEYVCRAFNVHATVDSLPATISVLFPPEFAIQPESIDALNSSTASLNCSVKGNPPPLITWLFNGGLITPGDRISILSNGTLVIEPVNMLDMGSYHCEANNSQGAAVSDFALLMVDFFPVFTATPQGTSVALGDPAVLNCSAMAIPTAVYEWSRDGVSVEVDDVRLRMENGSLVFSEVTRGDAGSYVCTASNLYGSITAPPAELFVSGPPLPPTVTLEAVGATWLSLTWPQVEANPPVTGYTVLYRLSFQSSFTELNVTLPPRANLSSLYPNADYVVQVKSESPAGSSEPSSPVPQARTSPGLPMGEGIKNGPDDLRIEHASPDHLMVHWTVPQELLRTSYHMAKVYLVNMNGSEVVVKETMESPVSLTNLTPATPYSVEIEFLFVGGHIGPRTRRAVTTTDGLPSSPENVTVVVAGPHTLTVTWSPPSQPNGTITTYTLVIRSIERIVVVRGNETQVVVSGLEAYTRYTLELSANTSAGQGEICSQDVRTAEDVPPPPTGLSVEAVSPTELLLSWQPLMNVPGVLGNYTVRLLDQASDRVVNSTGNELLWSGLRPYTRYNVAIAGTTGAGTGNFSDPVEGLTLSDIPTSVPTVVSVDPSCPNNLMVTWMNSEPMGLNGPLSQTQLVVVYERMGASMNMTIEYNSTGGGSFVIERVVHYTNYSVSMAISNANGTGNFSNTVTVRSCDALADPPANVSVLPISSTTISVMWQLPVEEIAGVLVNYTISYFTDSTSEQTLSVPAHSNSALLTELTPYTLYSVGVASVTRSGPGNSSALFAVRTFSDVPTSVPTVVSVDPSCPSDLTVTWMNSEPMGLNGPLNQTQLVVNVNQSENSSFMDYNVSGYGVFTLPNLTIDTTYNLTLALSNTNGTGPFSPPFPATTLPEGLSTPPQNVQVSTNSSDSIVVSWKPPREPNGDPNYIVFYRRANTSQVFGTVAAESLNATLAGLEVFTDYEIAVSANTSCGESNKSMFIEGQTPPTAPEGLNVTAVLPSALVIVWAEPVGDGTLVEYQVTCGSGSPVTTVMLSYECTGLEPNTNYSITVRASNNGGLGPPNTIATTTACADLHPLVKAGNNDTLTVSLPSSPQENCTRARVEFVLVIVQGLAANGNSYDPPSRLISNYTLEELLKLTGLHRGSRSKRQAESMVYITANISEIMLKDGFVVGDDKEYGRFINHRLSPGVFYTVGLRGIVAGASTSTYADSAESNPITAAPPSSTPSTTPSTTSQPTTTTAFPVVIVAASAGAAAFLLFAILLVACIICACSYCNRRASKYIVSNGAGRMERSSSFRLSSKRKTTDPVDEFRANHRTEALEDHPPVPVVGFVNKLLVMRTNDNQLFLEEFGSISSTPQHSTDIADNSTNKKKNRYNNILPYDNNRVKLKSHGGSDYVNASYCSGYMKNKAYVATQGPLADTVGDFWRLVWEENIRTIVMLTNVSEKGKVKCETYWPRDLGCSSVHGHIEVIMDQTTQLADFTIRTFSVHKASSSKEGRIVKQFHFTSWPDHGVPQYATAMLSMLRRVRSYHGKASGGPMLVHCSAGVGRTGTFIVIDSMLQRLRDGDTLLDIYGHVTLLRTQRNYMVQTEDQYFFIHEAVAEALLCGNTEVALEGLGAYVTELGSAISEDDHDITHIEVQFKRLAIDKNDPYRYLTANKDANKLKNRLVNILPYETNRVVLEYMRGVDGSDYINASHIDSYHNRRAFIATQGPLPHTVGDFWRMVWQYNSPVIVMLTELVEKNQERCSQYWPAEVLQTEVYDRFRVELAVERHSEHYTFRDINITDTQSGQKRCVSHFQFHGWPEVGLPATPTNLLDFIREVQKMYSILHTRTPITVHCSAGVGRTGVFITLHITLERMATEGLVDIFQTVKNLRIQRPAMVQTLQQYQFCYESTLHYLESSDLLTRQRSAHPSTELSRKRSFRHTPPSSQASPSRTSGTLPSRTDSFKGSARNFEMSGNKGAQIYGGSEATSTFGSHQQSTTNTSLSHSPASGSQTLASPYSGSQSQLSPYGGSQSHLAPHGGSQLQLTPYGNSQSQLSGGSQSPLQRYGGSQSQLSSQSQGPVHVRNTSVSGVTSHLPHQLAESQRYSNCSGGGWGADTQ